MTDQTRAALIGAYRRVKHENLENPLGTPSKFQPKPKHLRFFQRESDSTFFEILVKKLNLHLIYQAKRFALDMP